MTTDTALALLAEARKFMDHYWACNRSRFGFHEKCGCGRDELLNRITALLDSGGWMPIETAPKDGTRIALLSEHKNIWRECRWVKMTRVPDRWESFAVGRVPFNPIAWHPDPLPPLPKGDIK